MIDWFKNKYGIYSGEIIEEKLSALSNPIALIKYVVWLKLALLRSAPLKSALWISEPEKSALFSLAIKKLVHFAIVFVIVEFFNEARFKEFLAEYKLNSNDTYKKEINGVIKIYIGKFKSYDEAKAVKQKLIEGNNLTDSFVVSY